MTVESERENRSKPNPFVPSEVEGPPRTLSLDFGLWAEVYPERGC